MKSVATMVKQLEGMLDTRDLTDWENYFVRSVVDRLANSVKATTDLTGKQVEIVEQIWRKHFA